MEIVTVTLAAAAEVGGCSGEVRLLAKLALGAGGKVSVHRVGGPALHTSDSGYPNGAPGGKMLFVI